MFSSIMLRYIQKIYNILSHVEPKFYIEKKYALRNDNISLFLSGETNEN